MKHAKNTRSVTRTRRNFLCVLPLMTLAGCFAVHTAYHPNASDEDPDTRPDIREVVGPARSEQPLRLSVSTRADVEQVLGTPAAKSDDDQIFVYSQQMFSGHGAVLPPLYSASGPLRQRTYFLRIEFDEAGLLRSHSITKGDASDAGMGYMINEPDPVPARLLVK